jgi:hypothetical protein
MFLLFLIFAVSGFFFPPMWLAAAITFWLWLKLGESSPAPIRRQSYAPEPTIFEESSESAPPTATTIPSDQNDLKVFDSLVGGPDSSHANPKQNNAAESFRAQYRPKCFYHFTDTRNIDSILANDGLLSLSEMRVQRVTPPVPSSSASSRVTDSRKGMDRYVHLCFVNENPMEFRAKEDGRIIESVFLQINPAILDVDGILLTAAFANKTGIAPVGLDEALTDPTFDFDILYDRNGKRKDWERYDKAWRYEILVPCRIPLSYITIPSSYIVNAPKRVAESDFDDDIPF